MLWVGTTLTRAAIANAVLYPHVVGYDGIGDDPTFALTGYGVQCWGLASQLGQCYSAAALNFDDPVGA